MAAPDKPEHEHPTPAEEAFGAHSRSQRRQAAERDRAPAPKPRSPKDVPIKPLN